MGLGKDLVAVSDAGPLIHLAQIGNLQLLDIFSSVHIPDAVWMETVTAGRVDGTELTAVANIRRHAIDDAALRRFVQEFGPFSLHQGETEALLLCRRLDSPLLLADDLAAREAAWRQGVRPVGSLGIVVRVSWRPHFPDKGRKLHPAALRRKFPVCRQGNRRSGNGTVATAAVSSIAFTR